MADLPTVEQAGSATVWFTTQAGITATVLAVGCILLLAALIWSIRHCRQELTGMAKSHAADLKTASDAYEKRLKEMADAWGKRIDQMRDDIKEAFGQNSDIADKVVAALHSVQNEIARMSGRHDR